MRRIGFGTWSLSTIWSGLAAIAALLATAHALAGSTTLAWNPVVNSKLAGYVVHYGSQAGNYATRIDVGNTTSRTIANLTEGATYHFAVTAYDASRTESLYSNVVSVTIPYSVPVANFTASTTTGIAPLALNFRNTSTGSITGYRWSFGDGTTSTYANPSHVYAAPGVYTVSLTVSGSGGSNTKSIANYIRVSTSADTMPPTATTSLVATATSASGINLAWKAATDNKAVTGYRIERCQGAACTAFAQIATATGTSFSNSGLAAATTYRYRVRAADAAGNVGAYSNIAAATTSAASSRVATTTRLASTPNPSLAGGSVTFTASVTGSSPTGTVRFNDGGTAISGCSAIALVGTTNTRTATCVTKSLIAGSHAIVAQYSGNASNAPSTSGTLTQLVKVATSTGVNVALAANGGVATASSTLSTANAAKYVNDNRRSGAGWATGGGWNDATYRAFPDWVQIAFRASSTIDRVVVYSVQDNYQYPVEPTATLTFTKYGITAFQVQAWNGASWVTLASVTGNNLVKRTVRFTPFTTARVRVLVNGVVDGAWSRIPEIEAWTAN